MLRAFRGQKTTTQIKTNDQIKTVHQPEYSTTQPGHSGQRQGRALRRSPAPLHQLLKVSDVGESSLDSDIDFTAITKLSKDLKQSVQTLQPRQVRYLVDTYYQMQENRKRAANQLRALTEAKEPSGVVEWLQKNNRFLENQIKAALLAYSESQPMGRWAMSHIGIGPVISAGLLAHIDMDRCPTYGHLWSFAGLTTGFNMPVKWEKGQKRPWNAALKTLCWKASDCFVKFSGHDDCFYGHLYAGYKTGLIAKNDALGFKTAADEGAKRVGKTTEAWKSYSIGKLPDGHIHARAMRYTVKIFLSHWWEEAYMQKFQKPAPSPYPIAHLNHVHLIKSPVPSMSGITLASQ